MYLFRVLMVSALVAGLAGPVNAQVSAGNRLEHIKEAKAVRVCIWPDYYSITYRNPKTQQLSGIDIDMANELGKDLSVAVQFIDSSFAKLIDDVTQDRCSPNPTWPATSLPSPPKPIAASRAGKTSTRPARWWQWPKAPCMSRS